MHTPHRGALDIGSNTVMMLVAREHNGGLVEEREWYRATRLGEGAERSGSLSEDAIERTVAAAAEILHDARNAFPGLSGTAVATSAAREAGNRDDFLKRCRRKLGFSPLLLSGADEARYVFQGVASDRHSGEPLIHIDIGGGSSEITGGMRGACRFAESVPVGCVRLGERFDLFGVSSASSRSAAAEAVRDRLGCVVDRLLRAVPERGEACTILATGGSATTFAAMCLGLDEYDRERIHGFAGRADVLRETVASLAALEPEARAGRPGITSDRAAVLPAGLLILSNFLDLLGAESFQVSTRGLRAGLIDAMIRGTHTPRW
jgi:exopolyphosphatase/guanosine-5'-triphosphate,3'-diphosphate pyrophosphatase